MMKRTDEDNQKALARYRYLRASYAQQIERLDHSINRLEQALGVEEEGTVETLDDTLLGVMKGIFEDLGSTSAEEVLELMRLKGVGHQVSIGLIRRLKQTGDIYEPTPGVLKVL